MELAQIGQAFRNDALIVVLLNFPLQQLRMPVPAVPALLPADSLVG